MKGTETLTDARSSSHTLAYGLLVAAFGELAGDDIWNDYTPAERAVVAHAAEIRRPMIEQAAKDIIAWLVAG